VRGIWSHSATYHASEIRLQVYAESEGFQRDSGAPRESSTVLQAEGGSTRPTALQTPAHLRGPQVKPARVVLHE
jgi:hypothetical protein